MTATDRTERQRPAKRKPESGIAYAVTGGALLLGTLALVVFGRFEETPVTFAALAGGVALGAWLFRWGHRSWISIPCLFVSLAAFIALASFAGGGTSIAWIGGFVAGTNLGAGWRLATRRTPEARGTMAGVRPTVDSVRADIISAIAEMRAVAQEEQDEQRTRTADYLDQRFAGVTDRQGLREAAEGALTLYGGAGTFADVGTAESARAVVNLQEALHMARSRFVRNT
ncbi:hypothetical protein [Arthrobacter sp. USHLN218]|uniref:hypothetical protein n=1 Tax=Arthrobacter sp. USHLN218 TaxID=3081232 RepID=UPI003016557B